MIRRDFFTAHNILSNSIGISESAWQLEQIALGNVVGAKGKLVSLPQETLDLMVQQGKERLLTVCNQVKVIESIIDTQLPLIDDCFSFMQFSKKDAFDDVDMVKSILDQEDSLPSLIDYKAKTTKTLLPIPHGTNNTYILHDIIETIGYELRGLNSHTGQPHGKTSEKLEASIELHLQAAGHHLKQPLEADDKSVMGNLLDYIETNFKTDSASVGQYIEVNHSPLIMVRRAWLWL